MQIQDFIKNHGLRMVSTRVPVNPYMDDMPEESGHFACEILSKTNSMIVFYSVGPGAMDSAIPARTMRRIKHFAGENPKTVAYQDAIKAERMVYRPKLADVLDCLANDAQSIESAVNLEDWADDMGWRCSECGAINPKAQRAWETIKKQSQALQTQLGEASYRYLLEKVERL